MIIYDQDKTEHTDISSIGDRYDRVYSDKLHEQEDAIHNNTITHWDNMPNNKEIEWITGYFVNPNSNKFASFDRKKTAISKQ